MAAIDEARRQLGGLDLSYLDDERRVAQDTYNTTKTSLSNNYNNLIDQINKNRESVKKDFNSGRSTVSESAYDTNRANNADLASRGLGKTGLKQLSEVGNRIETGRQYSDLANTYYNAIDDLANKEKVGTENYNLDNETALNQYNTSMANINGREKEAKNNYNITLANLAEQIQSRWDANANAQRAYQQSLDDAYRNTISNILSNNPNTKVGNFSTVLDLLNSAASGSPGMLDYAKRTYGIKDFNDLLLKYGYVPASPLKPTGIK